MCLQQRNPALCMMESKFAGRYARRNGIGCDGHLTTGTLSPLSMISSTATFPKVCDSRHYCSISFLHRLPEPRCCCRGVSVPYSKIHIPAQSCPNPKPSHVYFHAVEPFPSHHIASPQAHFDSEIPCALVTSSIWSWLLLHWSADVLCSSSPRGTVPMWME